jgi:hypothetical protein
MRSAQLCHGQHPTLQRHAVCFMADNGDADATNAPYNRGAQTNAQALRDMETLILSLSFDSDDASRRKKVSTLFQEKLQARTNGEIDHGTPFEILFNQVLIEVGDRIRMEAQAQAQAAAEMSMSLEKDSGDDLPSFPLPAQQKKSQTELQLWALIDMMVQSKTLVRMAAGQLGSEGRFG